MKIQKKYSLVIGTHILYIKLQPINPPVGVFVAQNTAAVVPERGYRHNLPAIHSLGCVHPLCECTQVLGDVHSHDYLAFGLVVVAVHITLDLCTST